MISGVFIALLAIVLSLIYWLFSLDKARRDLADIPGPKPLPILGNALELSTDGHVFYNQLMNYARTYGTIVKLMFGHRPVLMVSSPEGAEVILSSTKHLTKSHEYDYLHPWLKYGLLTSTGDKWRTRRKMLTPTFHFRILNDFMTVFNEQAAVMMSRLDKACDSGELDAFPYITLCALDIICETAMGRKVDAQLSEGKSDYVEALYEISDIIMRRVRTPWLQPDAVFKMFPSGKAHDQCLKILQDFTRNVIEERDREIKEAGGLKLNFDSDDESFVQQTKGRRLAFLDLLLSMAKDQGLTHSDIQEEVDTFMFEGHDTTAAAMSWAVHFIGSEPEVQKKLHEEVDRVFGDSDRAATMADLREMKYLECTIKESLRMYPSVTFFARELDSDTQIEGHFISKGTTVSVLVAAMNRNPKIFPDPERFDPNRFSKEESTKRHPFAYVPFSAGPRNCIGQKFAMNEAKVILCSLLRRFNIESTQKREELKPETTLILRPAAGIKVKLSLRH